MQTIKTEITHCCHDVCMCVFVCVGVCVCVCVCVCIWACRTCGAMLLESALSSSVAQVTIDIQTTEVMGNRNCVVYVPCITMRDK